MAVPTTQGFRAREKNWISFNKTVFATAVHRDSITQILIQTGRKKVADSYLLLNTNGTRTGLECFP